MTYSSKRNSIMYHYTKELIPSKQPFLGPFDLQSVNHFELLTMVVYQDFQALLTSHLQKYLMSLMTQKMEFYPDFPQNTVEGTS